MSKGDDLASGKRSATFTQATGQSELEQDLKVQNAPYVMEKYGITMERYRELTGMVARFEPLPNLEPIAIHAEELAVMKTWAESPTGREVLEFAISPQVGYEGEPFGETILVQRVEREHSSTLVLPDSLRAKSDIGYVKEVGPDVRKVQKGKLVLFDKFASHGAEIRLVDEDGIEREYLILNERDAILGLRKISLASQSQPESAPSPADGQIPPAA